jgi:mRNA interferase RelE/StbE
MSRHELQFSTHAAKNISKLPTLVKKRIATKLQFYMDMTDPLSQAKPLVNPSKGGQYRFRVGDYRIVFDIQGNVFLVLYVEHRRDVYR